ncbi:MAG: AI-2E family transporter [Candidatus Magasanikbacteria bacterium]|nr:AI-2E family transporter [Candidatus Magasanikbacteria bacterium]MCA9389569.1 AI-2E family transporter [Candidatus Magasanikbacteria bacterium]MCA9390760.1 AI-2E family transporter [Candidatus Magasanikbacteria bacterium]USN52253.1 MAG: AI-2E family transporter [Candidatus Nomurabacteria bacterium]HPF95205.1 AI-2E family transporter [bacterium]
MDRVYNVELSLNSLLKTLAFLLVIGLTWVLRDILVSVFLSILLAGLLYPLVVWAKQKNIPKTLAIGGLLLGFVIISATLVALLVPATLTQARLAIDSFNILSANQQWSSYIDIGSLQDIIPDPKSLLSQFASSIDIVATSFANIIIVIVLAFYMLLEESAAKTLFRSTIPDRYQEFATKALWQVVEKLGDWVRGQSFLSAVIAGAYFVGFSIVGVPYALLLALIGGLLEFVPYIGPVMAAVPALFFAFGISPWHSLAVLLFMLIVQQLQNHVLSPLVMRRAVGLSPVISILAFLIGAKLFGIAGALFAIPVATALSVVYTEYRKAFSLRVT